MAEKQDYSANSKSAARPKKLSLQDVLHAVWDSESDESDVDLESDFRESSMEEESDSDCENLEAVQTDISQQGQIDNDSSMDTNVSYHYLVNNLFCIAQLIWTKSNFDFCRLKILSRQKLLITKVRVKYHQNLRTLPMQMKTLRLNLILNPNQLLI